MAIKKYLSLDRLTEYDGLLKAKIATDDAATLDSAKGYTDDEITKIKDGTYMVSHAIGSNYAAQATSDINGRQIVDTYETKTDASSKLDTAKTYTDDEINKIKNGLYKAKYATEADSAMTADSATFAANATVASKANCDANGNFIDLTYETKTDAATKITTHNTDAEAHSDIRQSISDLSTQVNQFLDVDDTTKDQLSEVLTLIDNNKGTLDSLTTNKVNVSDIVDNLTTTDAKKVLSANQGVALKALIDGKAASDHNHDSAYDTKGAADDALDAAKGYVDTIADTIEGRLDTLEAAIGESGSIADDIATAKAEAIAEAGVDSSNKDAVVLAEAQRHTNDEIGKVTPRIDALDSKVGDGFEEITSAELQALFAEA